MIYQWLAGAVSCSKISTCHDECAFLKSDITTKRAYSCDVLETHCIIEVNEAKISDCVGTFSSCLMSAKFPIP